MIINYNPPRLIGGWIIFDSDLDVIIPMIINYNPPCLRGGGGWIKVENI